jgi:hypothetical protein
MREPALAQEPGVDSNASIDGLISRVRERAADPTRRVDERPSEFFASVSSAGLGDLLSMLRSVTGDLNRLMANGPDERIHERALDFQRGMTTPAERALSAPASATTLEASERELGVRFPTLLRRLYLEVANGGFGPGPGLVGVRGGATTDRGKSIEDLYAEMLDAQGENAAWVWPRMLVPVSDLGGVFACVDCATDAGRVVEFDFEELDEEGRGDGGWSRAFRERSPSLAAYLEEWLGADPPSSMPQFIVPPAPTADFVPEVTRQYWLGLTPEKRATFGLPETGWGLVLFGDAWGDDPRDGSAP